jgi:sulfane dehydrogenase subunit SoxC
MEAKSLITHPSYGQQLNDKGYYQISGLAWSGRGKSVKVEVSADAGRTWAEAELQEPVLAKCFTRFRIPWHWNGHTATLKSRATDETGYAQPERKILLAERGKHEYFHYNAIVSWQVSSTGEISHVYA